MGPFARKRSSSESRLTTRRTNKTSETDTSDKLPVPIGHCTLNTVEDNFHLFATLGKKKSLTKLLAKSNFPIDSPNCLGQSALFCAAYTGKEKVVQVLLHHGANPNFRCSGDYTPVHGACWSCNVKILILLLEAGGDLRSRDTQERQPKDWCILQTNKDKGQLVLQFINLLENTIATFSDQTFTRSQLNIPSQANSKLWEQLLNYAQRIARKNPTNTPSMPDFPPNFVHFLGHGNLCIGNNFQLTNISYIPHIQEENLRMTVSTGKYYSEASMVMERMEWNNTKVIRRKVKENCSMCMLDVLVLELEHLSQLRHPNLLLLMGVCPLLDYKSTSLVFENVEIGSLFYVLHEKRMSPNHSKCQEIILQICDALIFLHSKCFIHCAMSSHSIHLVTPSLAKLGNCGYMVQCRADGVGLRKTLDMIHFQELYHWLAPEIISDSRPTTASDVYGLASVLLEMLTIRLPWTNLSSEQIAHCLLRKNLHPELPPFVKEPFHTLLCEGLKTNVSDRVMSVVEMREILLDKKFTILREPTSLPAKTSYSADSLITHHMEGQSPSLLSDAQSKSDEKFTVQEELFPSRKMDAKLQRGQTMPRLNFRQEPFQSSIADDSYNFIKNPEKRKFFQSTPVSIATLPLRASKNASGRYSVTPRPTSNKNNDDTANNNDNSSSSNSNNNNNSSRANAQKSFHFALSDVKPPYQCQSAREAKSPIEPKKFNSSCSLHTSQTSRLLQMGEGAPVPDIKRSEPHYSGKHDSSKQYYYNIGSSVVSSRGDMTPPPATTSNAISIKPASHLTGTPLGINKVAHKSSDTNIPFTRYSQVFCDKGGSATTLWNDSSSVTTDSLEVHASCTSSPSDIEHGRLAPAMDEWFAGRGSVQGLISTFETRDEDKRNASFGSWKSLTLSDEKKTCSSPLVKTTDKLPMAPFRKKNSFVIERRQSLGAEYGDLEISVSSSTPSKTTPSTGVNEKSALRNVSLDAPIEDLYFDDELNESTCQEEHLKLLQGDAQQKNTAFTAKIAPVFTETFANENEVGNADDSNPSTPRSISDIQLEDATIKVIQVKAEPGYSCTVRTESNSLGSGTHHVTLTKKHMESGKEEVIEEVIHADVVQHHIIMEK